MAIDMTGEIDDFDSPGWDTMSDEEKIDCLEQLRRINAQAVELAALLPYFYDTGPAR